MVRRLDLGASYVALVPASQPKAPGSANSSLVPTNDPEHQI